MAEQENRENFEHITSPANEDKEPEKGSNKLDRKDNTKLKNEIFEEVISWELMKQFSEEMVELGMEKDIAKEVFDTVFKITDFEEIKRILCIPYELRQKKFLKYIKEKTEPTEIVKAMEEDAKKIEGRYFLGFYTSSKELPKQTLRNSQGESVVWETGKTTISRNYDEIARVGGAKYLYVVRAEKQQLGNPQGDRLPIVAQVDLDHMKFVVEKLLKKAS